MRTELKIHLLTVKNITNNLFDNWCEDFKIEEAYGLPAVRLFNVWSQVKIPGTNLTYGKMSDKEILMYPITLYGDMWIEQVSRPENTDDIALWLWRTKEEVLASVKEPVKEPVEKSIFDWFKGKLK